MKKYAKLIPNILFPYLFLLLAVLLCTAINSDTIANIGFLSENMLFLILAVIFLLPIVWTLVFSIVFGKKIRKMNTDLKSVSTSALIIKCSTAPAFIINHIFIVGFCLLGIWGLGLTAFLMFVNFWTLLTSGIIFCGFIKRLNTEEMFVSKKYRWLYFCSFIMLADSITTAVLFVKLKNKQWHKAEFFDNIIVKENQESYANIP